MKKLGLYQGSDLPYFKRFDLDLAYSGVTIIRGVNKNVGGGMVERNNGSGKSLLLSGLAEILISSNPAIERNEMVARKVLFPNPTSMVMLEIDRKVIAKGRFGGATVSYGIESGSGGLEKVKKDVATEYLVETLGYNEDLFYTLVFLDGGRDFPLIVGTPTQRIQFLSNIFADIEMFGDFHSHFSSKLKDFQQKLHTKETLEAELSELIGTDDDEEMLVKDSDIAKLEKVLKKSKDALSIIQKTISNAEMQTTYKRLDDAIQKNCIELGIDSENITKCMARELESRRAYREYEALSSRVEKFKNKKSELIARKRELEDSDMDDSNYDLIDQADEMSEIYKEWVTQIRNLINELHKALGIPFRIGTPKTPAQYADCDTLLDTVAFYINDRGSLVSKEGKSSPTVMGKSLDSNEILDHLSRIGSIRKKINSLISNKVDIDSLGTPLTKAEIKTARLARKNLNEWQSLDDELAEVSDSYKRLKSDLGELTKPTIRPIKIFDLLGTTARDIGTLDSLGFNGNDMDDVPDLVSLQREAKSLEAKVLTTREELAELKERKRFNEENVSVIDGLKSRISKLNKYERAVPLMASIKKAFSTNGIRTQVLSKLTGVLADKMNANSHLAFPEPVKFEFTVSERDCSIVVTRNPNTKHSVSSDIRTLSRGERKSFNLLLLYCLLPMIPNNKRVNIVVMDEMTSNMDAPTKLKIFRDFIPALRNVVPHIIIADTGNLEIDEAREFNVVKKGSVSTLETA